MYSQKKKFIKSVWYGCPAEFIFTDARTTNAMKMKRNLNKKGHNREMDNSLLSFAALYFLPASINVTPLRQ